MDVNACAACGHPAEDHEDEGHAPCLIAGCACEGYRAPGEEQDVLNAKSV